MQGMTDRFPYGHSIGDVKLSDVTIMALMLGTCSIMLWGGVVHLARTRGDVVSLVALTGFAVLSTLMAYGPLVDAIG